MKDEKRSGRPQSARTQGNIDRVLRAVETERSSTIAELAEHLNLSQTSVRTMLKTDLKMTKLCPKFIPRILTEEQKAFRVRLCQENLDWLCRDNTLLQKIITGDESWVSVAEVPLKKDSKEWHPKGGTRPLKALRSRSARKSMLTAFFDMEGPVMAEFSPPGTTVTSETYCEVIKTLKE